MRNAGATVYNSDTIIQLHQSNGIAIAIHIWFEMTIFAVGHQLGIFCDERCMFDGRLSPYWLPVKA